MTSPAPSARPPTRPHGIARTAALRVVPLAALAASLAGCASGGFSLSQGGMSDATSSFASDHSYSYSCSKFDPTTGAMTDQVVVSRNINPDAQAVAAMGSAFQAVVGLVGAAAKPVPGPMGGARGIPGGSTLDVPTCLGEHGVNTPMPVPPNPLPPQQSGRQQSALPPAPAGRPAMLEAPDPDAAVQGRVRRASPDQGN